MFFKKICQGHWKIKYVRFTLSTATWKLNLKLFSLEVSRKVIKYHKTTRVGSFFYIAAKIKRNAVNLTTENELKPRRNKFKYKELTICKYITKTFFIHVKSPIDIIVNWTHDSTFFNCKFRFPWLRAWRLVRIARKNFYFPVVNIISTKFQCSFYDFLLKTTDDCYLIFKYMIVNHS